MAKTTKSNGLSTVTHNYPAMSIAQAAAGIKVEIKKPSVMAGYGACSACSCKGYKPKDGFCGNCGHHSSLHA